MKGILLAILSGVLLITIFPEFNYKHLAWLSLVPLLLALDGKGWKGRFFLGFIAGFVYFLGAVNWITISMNQYGGMPYFVSFLVLLLFSVYLALYVALFSVLIGKRALYIVPLAWVATEYTRSFLMTGFPWAFLGHSQHNNLPLIQIADITGVYGISFLIALGNSILKEVILWLTRKRNFPKVGTLFFLVLLSWTILYGVLRLKELRVASREISFDFSIVQGNIAQDIKWNPDFAQKTIEIYQSLSLEDSKGRPQFILWPEASVPFYYPLEEEYLSMISGVAKNTGAFLLFGCPTDKEGKYYNSAYLVSPEGEVIGNYHKTHLVPFGEYVPMAKFLPFVRKLAYGIGDFSAGEKLEGIDSPLGKIGIMICFESIFPDIGRNLAKDGALFLVNITNDAWFGDSSAPYQHLSIAAFRAIESRLPMLRAANTGISAFVANTGAIMHKLDLFSRGTLEGRLELSNKPRLTFYVRHGDLFAKTCLVLTLVLVSVSVIRTPYEHVPRTWI